MARTRGERRLFAFHNLDFFGMADFLLRVARAS
jgi:hypothetical protein